MIYEHHSIKGTVDGNSVVVPIEVIRERRKTFAIYVQRECAKLYIPFRHENKTYSLFLNQKAKWILKRSYLLRKAFQEMELKEDEIWILGQKHRLVDDSHHYIDFSEKNTSLPQKNRAKFLCSQATAFLHTRAKELAVPYDISFDVSVVRPYRSKWGSCSRTNTLKLNTLLFHTPIHIVDSVIFHEFAHITSMKHDKKFYDALFRYYPDYNAADQWFKQYGSALIEILGDRFYCRDI